MGGKIHQNTAWLFSLKRVLPFQDYVRLMLRYLDKIVFLHQNLKRSFFMLFGYRFSAILFILFSTVSLLVLNRELSSYETAPGVIVQLISIREDLCMSSGTFLFRASAPECVAESYIVRFQTKAGKWIETNFIAAGNDSVPRLGDKLTVAYDPSDPKGTATEYKGVMWGFVFSIAICSLGLCMLLLDWIWHRLFRKKVRWGKHILMEDPMHFHSP